MTAGDVVWISVDGTTPQVDVLETFDALMSSEFNEQLRYAKYSKKYKI